MPGFPSARRPVPCRPSAGRPGGWRNPRGALGSFPSAQGQVPSARASTEPGGGLKTRAARGSSGEGKREGRRRGAGGAPAGRRGRGSSARGAAARPLRPSPRRAHRRRGPPPRSRLVRPPLPHAGPSAGRRGVCPVPPLRGVGLERRSPVRRGRVRARSGRPRPAFGAGRDACLGPGARRSPRERESGGASRGRLPAVRARGGCVRRASGAPRRPSPFPRVRAAVSPRRREPRPSRPSPPSPLSHRLCPRPRRPRRSCEREVRRGAVSQARLRAEARGAGAAPRSVPVPPRRRSRVRCERAARARERRRRPEVEDRERKARGVGGVRLGAFARAAPVGQLWRGLLPRRARARCRAVVGSGPARRAGLLPGRRVPSRALPSRGSSCRAEAEPGAWSVPEARQGRFPRSGARAPRPSRSVALCFSLLSFDGVLVSGLAEATLVRPVPLRGGPGVGALRGAVRCGGAAFPGWKASEKVEGLPARAGRCRKSDNS